MLTSELQSVFQTERICGIFTVFIVQMILIFFILLFF